MDQNMEPTNLEPTLETEEAILEPTTTAAPVDSALDDLLSNPF